MIKCGLYELQSAFVFKLKQSSASLLAKKLLIGSGN